jgi:hypothetical protein
MIRMHEMFVTSVPGVDYIQFITDTAQLYRQKMRSFFFWGGGAKFCNGLTQYYDL